MTFKQRVNDLKLSHKHVFIVQTLSFILPLLIGLALFVITRQLIFLGICAIAPLALLGYQQLIVNKHESVLMKRNKAFVTSFNYLRLYLANHQNVYQALKSVERLGIVEINEPLQQLITAIDDDKTVAPFINYAHHFTHPLTEEVMMAVFQLVDNGMAGNFLYQFNYLFNRMNAETDKAAINKLNRNFEQLTMFPLLGAGVLVLGLAFGVMMMIGRSLYGF